MPQPVDTVAGNLCNRTQLAKLACNRVLVPRSPVLSHKEATFVGAQSSAFGEPRHKGTACLTHILNCLKSLRPQRERLANPRLASRQGHTIAVEVTPL